MTNDQSVGAFAVAERRVLKESGSWRWWMASVPLLVTGFVSALCLFRWNWGQPVIMAMFLTVSLIGMTVCQGRAVKVEQRYRESEGAGE